MQTWLEEIDRSFPEKKWLLCLDEFERLGEVVEATGSRAPLNFLRHVMQHRSRWILLFSGSHTFGELPAYWSDYLINARSVRVGILSRKETQDLVLKPIDNFPSIYPPEIVEEIIRLTGCHPFLTQLLCFQIVERLNRNKQKEATSEDVEQGIQQSFQAGEIYFDELWNDTLKEEERQFLIRLFHDRLSSEENKKIIHSLLNKEILKETETGLKYRIPLIQTYIEKKIREEE